ncbi:hypothetical protein JQ615_11720 [Bradyrhizobium jicamae]|uniref:Uncharacterized protein n=1 Tax=Bradyrhizobium jicamae TaxID=280332 RepID=A0ABS5FH01_9BRAD|nr:hypothetical protein [Bradyrhizobium jicamae]MBR0796057.1 hypothetical protein [Bradyrhizobium jicamae]
MLHRKIRRDGIPCGSCDRSMTSPHAVPCEACEVNARFGNGGFAGRECTPPSAMNPFVICRHHGFGVIARLDRAIRYSRGSFAWAEEPQRTGSPTFAGEDN